MTNGIEHNGTDSQRPTDSILPVHITVLGRARPAGSKKAFRSYVTADNPYVEAWMQEVRSAASKVMDGRPLLEGALRLTCHFYFARPKGHYGTGKNRDKLKASSPEYMTGTPDLTKLVRAVEDALSHTVWLDDAQVCQHGLNSKGFSPDGREWADIIVELPGPPTTPGTLLGLF